MSRRQRIDSAEAAVAVMASVARKIVPPACEPLEETDWAFWDAVVCARSRAEWTDENLIVAAKLTRALADESRIVRELRSEGDLIKNDRGTMVVNPKHALVEQLARRVMAWRKALALDARGTDGRVSEITKRRETARHIETNNAFEGDDLLARPPSSMQ